MEPVISVEEVRGAARRRFTELPWFLHRAEPRWAPPLAAFERWRLDRHRHPYYRDADWQAFLVRRGGAVVGRMMAHLPPGESEAKFGFYDVADDADAATALFEAAGEWSRELGAIRMVGPISPTPEEESGVRVQGFDVVGVTGRQWHPPWYAAHAVAAGLVEVPGSASRMLTRATEPGDGDIGDGPLPPHAGRFGDRRLAGTAIAAVPDVASALRGGSARSLVRAAPTTCCVVRGGDDPRAVDALTARAHACGYGSVVVPAAPDQPDDTVHQLLALEL